MEEVTLKRTGYRVSGTAYVTLWGGDKASILMRPFEVEELTEESVAKGINDGAFGVESIDKAICHIQIIYGWSYKMYIGTWIFENGKCVSKELVE